MVTAVLHKFQWFPSDLAVTEDGSTIHAAPEFAIARLFAVHPWDVGNMCTVPEY